MLNELLFTQKGHIGIITLNRTQALNALSLEMILALQNQLAQWKENKSIHAVVITSAHEKVFCAGGDVRWLYQTGKNQDLKQMDFFWHEYRLNHFIHHFGKPYIALMNGITMGGGVGISLHGSHPVASEQFSFAMPETGIGFFPDIGASHLLSRCPGTLGLYLALTGNRLGPDEALQAGLVKYIIPTATMPELLNELSKQDLSEEAHSRVHTFLESFQKPAQAQAIDALIQNSFSQPSVELILRSLKNSEDGVAQELHSNLIKKAPLSLKVTFTQYHKANGLSLADCLKMDYKLVGHFMSDTDFYEGVRALLIDKDKNPQWNPKSLDAISEQMVITYFEQMTQELRLD